MKLSEMAAGRIRVVHVPKTIDNDLDNTDYTFGFDTAQSIATEAIDRLGPGPSSASGSTLRRLPSAAYGLGMAASERVLSVSAQVESSAGFAVQAARSLPVIGSTIAAGDRAVERWSERGAEEQAGNEALLSAFVARLVPELATAIVERLDLAAIIAAVPISGAISVRHGWKPSRASVRK